MINDSSGQLPTALVWLWRLLSPFSFYRSPLFDAGFYLGTTEAVSWWWRGVAVGHYLWRGRRQEFQPHPLFDPAWYRRTCPGAADSPLDLLIHYLKIGAARDVQPHPLFDPAYYRRQQPNGDFGSLIPLVHYLTLGAAQGVSPHPLFDAAYYLKAHPEVAAAGLNPLVHYLGTGAAQGFQPHPLFDSAYYLETHPEVAAAGVNPLLHYLETGAAQGFQPHPLFDPVWYLGTHPEVAAAGLNPLVHYLETGAAQGFQPHPLFDPVWYGRTYPEVVAAGLNPLVHYLQIGAAQGFQPHPLFDSAWYRRHTLEGVESGLDPLSHYIRFGAARGAQPHPLFNAAWYLRRAPEVAAAGFEALFHYSIHGAAQGLSPHPLFDAVWYWENHPETAGLNPLIHYLEQGAAQGYAPHWLFDPAHYRRSHPEAAECEPLTHYLEWGAAQGFSPHPLFDPAHYRRHHPETVDCEPLTHYLEQGAAQGFSPHPLFDPAWYLERYPEISTAGLSPLRHYLEHGASEGRWPNPFFDGAFYRRTHPAAVNPLMDYLTTGAPPHPLFDPDFYRSRYPEAVADGTDPLAAYLAAQATGLDHDPFAIPAALHALKPLLLGENLADLDPPLTGNPFQRVLADLAGLETPDSWPAATWYDERTPELSILIINFNNAALTRLCLQALWAFTTGHRYEIVVLDNGSRDEDVAALEAFPGRYRLVRTPVNRFFGEGNNLALEASRGRFVLFLNNDALVTPGWLEPLLTTLEADPGIAAVGPQLLYLSGRLQEAGAQRDASGEPVRLGWGGRADDPAFGTLREVEYCSAAALICRRSALEAIGGFDWCWEPLYFEDVDLCLRLAQAGGRVLYHPGSHLYHIENASTRRLDRNREIDRIVALNRLKFLDRWHRPAGAVGADVVTIPVFSSTPALDLVPAAVSSPAPLRPVLAILADFPWRPSGPMRCALEIAAAAKDDFEVRLLTPEPWSHLRLFQMMTALGLPAHPVRVATLAEARAVSPALFVAFGPAPALGRRNLLVQRDRLEEGPMPEGFQALPMTLGSCYGHAFSTVKQPMIVAVGRFAPGTAQDELVCWFRIGFERGQLPDGTVLALAGVVAPTREDRAVFERVQELAQGLPVRLYPNASHRRLSALYREAALVWPTKPSQTLPVLEAMSAGAVPLVGAGGAAMTLIEPGRSGLVWNDPEALLEISGPLLAARGTPAGVAWSQAAHDRAEALTTGFKTWSHAIRP